MSAQLGLSNVLLAAGSLGRARAHADRFLATALSTAEPNRMTQLSRHNGVIAV